MPDLITLVRGHTIAPALTATYIQPAFEAVDVSGYDSVDLQYVLITDIAGPVSIDFFTSMQNKSEDYGNAITQNMLPTWIAIYSIAVPGVTSGKPSVGAQSLPMDSTTTPLLRYLRYSITLAAATANATLTIEGIARRGLRVG